MKILNLNKEKAIPHQHACLIEFVYVVFVSSSGTSNRHCCLLTQPQGGRLADAGMRRIRGGLKVGDERVGGVAVIDREGVGETGSAKNDYKHHHEDSQKHANHVFSALPVLT